MCENTFFFTEKKNVKDFCLGCLAILQIFATYHFGISTSKQSTQAGGAAQYLTLITTLLVFQIAAAGTSFVSLYGTAALKAFERLEIDDQII